MIRIPVFASVALHDPDGAAGNAPGPQARLVSDRDVYAKGDTTWPSAAGTAGTGASADWLVYPVELADGLGSASFAVYDAAAGDETYDLYLYDRSLALLGSTHPFVASGVTDQAATETARRPRRARPNASSSRPPPPVHFIFQRTRSIRGYRQSHNLRSQRRTKKHLKHFGFAWQ